MNTLILLYNNDSDMEDILQFKSLVVELKLHNIQPLFNRAGKIGELHDNLIMFFEVFE